MGRGLLKANGGLFLTLRYMEAEFLVGAIWASSIRDFPLVHPLVVAAATQCETPAHLWEAGKPWQWITVY